MAGKCPKCDQMITFVRLDDIDVRGSQKNWLGVSYQCPLCSTILSVSIDPIAVKTDLVNAVVKRLRGAAQT